MQISNNLHLVLSKIKDKGLRALIVDRRSDSDPYGIVTETDIVYKTAAFGHDPKKMRVYEIMTKPCVAVNPDLRVEYVARLFANTRIRRAPVIEGKLLGIISVSDILKKGEFVEKPKQLYIEDRIEAAREDARNICAEKGATSLQCAAAWDEVEELQAAAADRRQAKDASNSLKDYCAENPDALECRIYED